MEKIKFLLDTEEVAEFFVLEQTKLSGNQYILVTDVEEGDGEAYIMKDMSADGDEESVYDMVEDDAELEAVAEVFEKMLEDVTLEGPND